MTNHQQKQIEVINQLEEQIKDQNLSFSTVSPVEDFENDERLCLTSVHLPSIDLKSKITNLIIEPLKKISPKVYFYDDNSMHMTIKNIRVINNPPNFNIEDIKKAEEVFSEVVPNHKSFKVYFYRLLLFPNNLAIIGTTDSELDQIVIELDDRLKKAGVRDDKKYLNSKNFFVNMTLARFKEITPEFKEKVKELSSQINIEPYLIDSVSLITCNAVLKKLKIFYTWNLE